MFKRLLTLIIAFSLLAIPVIDIVAVSPSASNKNTQDESPSVLESWQKLVTFDWNRLSSSDAMNIVIPSALLGAGIYGITKYLFDQYNKETFSDFHAWQKACNKLPRYQTYRENSYRTPLHAQVLLQEIDTFLQTMKSQIDKTFWIDGVKPTHISDDFQAYVEKVIVPNNAIVAIHGDLHGDVHSVNRFIATCTQRGFLDEKNPFKIKNKNFYMFFLGDYVDRGWYGAEVIYTVLRLKNENPDNVFMVRGNHEDVWLNKSFGFSNEMDRKFSDNTLLAKINQLYNALPVALYLGAGKAGMYNFIQCCHGGIEIGFDPKKLLEDNHLRAGIKISQLTQQSGFNHICCEETNAFKRYFVDRQISTTNGFMWNDFIVAPNKALELSSRDGFRGTMFEYGQSITKQLLKAWSGKSYKLRSIFRAHQHGDMEMKERILNIDQLGHPLDAGLGKLWIQNSVHKYKSGLLDDVAVITFSVAPGTGYGWPIHSFGLLYMAPNYVNWRLENVAQKI